jgi:hypothetical protein
VAEISHTEVGEVARQRFHIRFLALGIIIAGLVLIASHPRPAAAFVVAV